MEFKKETNQEELKQMHESTKSNDMNAPTGRKFNQMEPVCNLWYCMDH